MTLSIKDFQKEMLARRVHNPKLVAKGLMDPKLRRLAVNLLIGKRFEEKMR